MTDDLVKLLRRPYGNLTFAEKKEVADRIEELEAKLAIAWDTQTVKILIKTAYKEGWADGEDNVPLGSGWEKSRTNATLDRIEGGKDE